MKLGRRILAVVIMALSVIVAIVCIAGIGGTWMINNSVKNDVVAVLTGVGSALDVADDALARTVTRVGTARDRVADFEATVETVGETVAEDPVLLRALSEKLDLGITPAIEELRETVQLARETIIGIQNAIEAINALPFVSIGDSVADREGLQQLSEGITALTEGVQETRNGVQQIRVQAATQVSSAIGRGTSRMDGGLALIEATAADYGTQISEQRKAVSDLKAQVTRSLNVASVIATFVLLWLVSSQAVVFVLGLSAYRHENLFARWTRPSQ